MLPLTDVAFSTLYRRSFGDASQSELRRTVLMVIVGTSGLCDGGLDWN